MSKSFSWQGVPPQTGRCAVITGATGGLGYETALALSAAGAQVILTGRNDAKGQAALDRIRAQHPGAQIGYEPLDLASLSSIAAFADRFAARYDSLDLLINNAGVMAYPKRKLTADGFEAQFGTNHLGHFALTARLLPLLRRDSSPRLVTVSSLAHRSGQMHFDDLQSERRYSPWSAYCQSKLANLLFAFEFQRRSEAEGWGILSAAAHPGYARTELIANGPGRSNPLQNLLATLLRPTMSHSSAAGAQPTLVAATSPAVDPASYFGPSGFYELKGPPALAHIASQARDEAAARQLWEVSEELTGVKF